MRDPAIGLKEDLELHWKRCLMKGAGLQTRTKGNCPVDIGLCVYGLYMVTNGREGLIGQDFSQIG